MGMVERRELSNHEKNVLESMPDHRSISDPLKTAFVSGGLFEFRKYVLGKNHDTSDKHKRIAILLRGNNNRIILYKYNHKISELSAREIQGKVICTVKFDFNHARYTDDWYKKWCTLENLGFSIGESKTAEYLPQELTEKATNGLIAKKLIKVTRNKHSVVNGGEIGTISCSRERFDDKFVEKCLGIFEELVEDFFASATMDYFREAVSLKYPEAKNISGNAASVFVEKRWQQRLLFHFNNLQDGYYAYDLEFAQKFPDKDFVDKLARKLENDEYKKVKAADIKAALGTNEPDMLAIRYEGGNPKALVLIEVKSTEIACMGDSSVEKHMQGMAEYAKQSIFISKRVTDAYESLKQYKEMGIIESGVEIKGLPENPPVEKVLLLTNSNISINECGSTKPSALDYYKQNKQSIKKWSDEYKCDVWITESNYFDNDIKIQPATY
ncbi:hypothetical protein [Butyrivibrio sp. XBB1001]|uniref:hypothetical protein n=1 Tax=Butyrivibrio sp. XBB1001 TaxID=1280682 RepID=UPI0003F5209C|nr:hypothetical protein [Butyrivibrio sp. XBB1001]